MKKFIIIIVTLVSLLYGNKILDKNIKNKINILNNQFEYEISRELLRSSIDKDNKIDAMKFWISLDEELLDELNHNIKDALTIVSPLPMSKTEADNRDWLWHCIPIVGDLIVLKKAEDGTLPSQKLAKLHIKLEDKHIDVLTIKAAKTYLNLYDELKKSQQTLKQLIDDYSIQDDTSEFKLLVQILKSYNSLKNKIKTQRINFISYSIVSPYLADAHRYIILSNYRRGIGHNERDLQKAAQQMAKGAYKDILLESNEDVRKQFYNVYQALKNVAGDKELEDLKVLQTLMDSSSKQKQTGSDKWWE